MWIVGTCSIFRRSSVCLEPVPHSQQNAACTRKEKNMKGQRLPSLSRPILPAAQTEGTCTSKNKSTQGLPPERSEGKKIIRHHQTIKFMYICWNQTSGTFTQLILMAWMQSASLDSNFTRPLLNPPSRSLRFYSMSKYVNGSGYLEGGLTEW